MAVMAGVVRNGRLTRRIEWENHVRRLRLKTAASAKNRRLMKKLLQKRLTEAVAKRIPPTKFGILFSGGVDSSLIAFICKELKADFMCYSVGVGESRDLTEAKKAAKKLKLRLRCKTFTLKEAEAVIRKATAVVGKPDAVNVGIACVSIAAAQLARKDGISTFFTGLGSEEIFAGYRRHELAKEANEECWKGLKDMWSRDFVRDFKVAAAMKISFLAPFLDKELIILAMGIPAECKIGSRGKKLILREAAADMGLPRETAFRKKLAAQYGSGFDRAIEKLAGAKGFHYKREYLASIQTQIHYSAGQFFRRQN